MKEDKSCLTKREFLKRKRTKLTTCEDNETCKNVPDRKGRRCILRKKFQKKSKESKKSNEFNNKTKSIQIQADTINVRTKNVNIQKIPRNDELDGYDIKNMSDLSSNSREESDSDSFDEITRKVSNSSNENIKDKIDLTSENDDDDSSVVIISEDSNYNSVSSFQEENNKTKIKLTLTDEESKFCNDIIKKISKNITPIKIDIIYPKDKIKIDGNSIKRRILNNEGWLDESIIHAYMFLIFLNSEHKESKSIFISCSLNYFMNIPKINHPDKSFDSFINETLKYFIIDDITECNYIYIPINKNNIHWILLRLKISKDDEKITFEFYDSLIEKNSEKFHKTVKNKIQKLFAERFSNFNFDIDIKRNIPQQNNGSDCGVFLLFYTFYLLNNYVIDFHSNDIPNFRKIMYHDLRNGKITGDRVIKIQSHESNEVADTLLNFSKKAVYKPSKSVQETNSIGNRYITYEERKKGIFNLKGCSQEFQDHLSDIKKYYKKCEKEILISLLKKRQTGYKIMGKLDEFSQRQITNKITKQNGGSNTDYNSMSRDDIIENLLKQDEDLVTSKGREFNGSDEVFKIHNMKLSHRNQMKSVGYIYVISKVIDNKRFYKIGTIYNKNGSFIINQSADVNKKKTGRLGDAQTFLIPGLENAGFKVHFLFFYGIEDKPDFNKAKSTSICASIEQEIHKNMRKKFTNKVITFPNNLESEWYIPGEDTCEKHFLSFLIDIVSIPNFILFLVEAWKLQEKDTIQLLDFEPKKNIENFLPDSENLKYRYGKIEELFGIQESFGLRNLPIASSSTEILIQNTDDEQEKLFGTLKEYNTFFNKSESNEVNNIHAANQYFEVGERKFQIINFFKPKKSRNIELGLPLQYREIYAKIKIRDDVIKEKDVILESDENYDDYLSVFPDKFFEIGNNGKRNNDYIIVHSKFILDKVVNLEKYKHNPDISKFRTYLENYEISPPLGIYSIRMNKIFPNWMRDYDTQKKYANIYTNQEYNPVHEDNGEHWKITGASFDDDNRLVYIKRQKVMINENNILKPVLNENEEIVTEHKNIIYFMVKFEESKNEKIINENINNSKIKTFELYDDVILSTFSCIKLKSDFFSHYSNDTSLSKNNTMPSKPDDKYFCIIIQILTKNGDTRFLLKELMDLRGEYKGEKNKTYESDIHELSKNFIELLGEDDKYCKELKDLYDEYRKKVKEEIKYTEDHLKSEGYYPIYEKGDLVEYFEAEKKNGEYTKRSILFYDDDDKDKGIVKVVNIIKNNEENKKEWSENVGKFDKSQFLTYAYKFAFVKEWSQRKKWHIRSNPNDIYYLYSPVNPVTHAATELATDKSLSFHKVSEADFDYLKLRRSTRNPKKKTSKKFVRKGKKISKKAETSKSTKNISSDKTKKPFVRTKIMTRSKTKSKTKK